MFCMDWLCWICNDWIFECFVWIDYVEFVTIGYSNVLYGLIMLNLYRLDIRMFCMDWLCWICNDWIFECFVWIDDVEFVMIGCLNVLYGLIMLNLYRLVIRMFFTDYCFFRRGRCSCAWDPIQVWDLHCDGGAGWRSSTRPPRMRMQLQFQRVP